MKSDITDTTRRRFLKNTLVAGALSPLASADLFATKVTAPAEKLKVYIFSKHLQFLEDYNDLAAAAKQMGFDGIDLAVRPGGHVEPDRVEEQLPKAAEAMKKIGFTPSLMTTAVNEAGNETDRRLLTTSSKLGFKYYRMNWYSYPENKPMPDALQELSQKVNGLGQLNRDLGLIGYYQNHAGLNIGSNIWEIYELIKDADKEHMGTQYDIRHAMFEGAESWPNGFKLIHSRIKNVSLKDFRWQQKNGKWMIEDVPIGEGMIDFKSYFKMLKAYRISVPVSMHVEYALGGAQSGSKTITIDKKDVFKAMTKDLKKIHEMWEQA
jgi:L-ribulose-5-phosphate 3-epimerase